MTGPSVQSVVLPKDRFSLQVARAWVIENGYNGHYPHHGPDSTARYYRFRQSASKLKRGERYASIRLRNGVILVLKYPPRTRRALNKKHHATRRRRPLL
jgi:hypothetical protein